MSVDVRAACFMTNRSHYQTAYSRAFPISTAQPTTSEFGYRCDREQTVAQGNPHQNERTIDRDS
jgi:hypothetical protein